MRHDTDLHGELFNQIGEILTGHPPAVQGSVLGDLVATWIAGHRSMEGDAETDSLRDELLRRHITLVRRLIPVNAEQIHEGGERRKKRAH